MYIQDTICAIATAPGGAIGIIRVSGPDAIIITNRIFVPTASPIPLTERKPYTLTFGEIVDEIPVFPSVVGKVDFGHQNQVVQHPGGVHQYSISFGIVHIVT